MYYALNCSQSNARPFKCISLMQALKYSEQFIYVLHIKAHSIVPDEYYQIIFVSAGAADLDFGLLARECTGLLEIGPRVVSMAAHTKSFSF